MNIDRVRFQASLPPMWPAIESIAVSLTCLCGWALVDSSAITVGKVALLFLAVFVLAQFGRFRLAEMLEDSSPWFLILGFAIGLTLLDLDGTTDADNSWQIFGPWFVGGLACSVFGRHTFGVVSFVARSLVKPGAYSAAPLANLMSQQWPQIHGEIATTSYCPVPVGRNVVRAVSASPGRGAVATAVCGGVAVVGGAAYVAGDFGGHSNSDQGFIYDEPTINPASGLPTIGGMGTPDIAMNSWCALDHSCPDVFYEAPFDGGGGFSDFS